MDDVLDFGSPNMILADGTLKYTDPVAIGRDFFCRQPVVKRVK
jgi:hypothetical protein